MKIDQKAVVPLGWVLSGFGLIFSTTIIGAFWVAAVNFRLQRIEHKLGIPALELATKEVSSDRLSRHVQLMPSHKRSVKSERALPYLQSDHGKPNYLRQCAKLHICPVGGYSRNSL